MSIVEILQHYSDRFKHKYGAHTTTDQWSALNAMLGCRTGQYGDVVLGCNHCGWSGSVPQSCGHRACQQCQHPTTVEWLGRQQQKLLPVNYFMVTFTLPRELRALAKSHPKQVYSALFEAASGTLKSFGLNDKKLAGEMGMTGVLHTHSRRLDYHPHLHFVVPAGALDKKRRQWRRKKGKYLFKQTNLATVFRARLLKTLQQTGHSCPDTPKEWIVDCQAVGRGLPALKYLSRYLYRGVISDRQIVNDDGNQVTFSYKNSQTGNTEKRTLPGEDFIALLLQHTLPKGFRRARDYGFLHGNAKRWLHLLQMILNVILPPPNPKPRPSFPCKVCRQAVSILGFIKPKCDTG